MDGRRAAGLGEAGAGRDRGSNIRGADCASMGEGQKRLIFGRIRGWTPTTEQVCRITSPRPFRSRDQLWLSFIARHSLYSYGYTLSYMIIIKYISALKVSCTEIHMNKRMDQRRAAGLGEAGAGRDRGSNIHGADRASTHSGGKNPTSRRREGWTPVVTAKLAWNSRVGTGWHYELGEKISRKIH